MPSAVLNAVDEIVLLRFVWGIYMKIRLFSLTIIVLLILTHPALAIDSPKITVAPIWRPATQLTTIDAGQPGVTNPNDDIRYVDAQIFVTTSVKFWAAQLTCTVNKAVLDTYIPGSDPNDWQDDGPVVTWGPDWGWYNNDFTEIPASFNPATGVMTITATRLGNRNGLGSNGYNYTLLLATIHYRVKNVAGTSPFTCTGNFLNRDGRPVLTPTFTAPAPLNVLTGYSISGNVSYQGRTVKSGIGVQCTSTQGGPNPPVYNTVTTAAGTYTINNIRALGWYNCLYFGNITNPSPGRQGDIYLQMSAYTDLSSQSYSFLPVTLLGGNLDRTTIGSESGVDNADVAVLTANWEKNALGDVNGDAKTDKSDLAIVGANYGEYEDTIADHTLYSVPRDWDGNFPNSRIWVGDLDAGAVTQLVSGSNRDFWPMMSPDGSKIAFVREVQGRYALFVVPSAGGTAVRVTPVNAWYDSFAPSWSPDGTRIAFNCSWRWDDNSDLSNRGWGFNQTDICVIDATGRNWQDIAGGNENHAKIYTPAWLSANEILYAGPSFNTTCPNNICYYNLQSGERRLFDIDIPSGADMPWVRIGWLYYRFTNGADRRLRMAEINDQGGVDAFEARNVAASPYHIDIQYFNGSAYLPLSTDVEWYSVAQVGPHIIFYPPGGYDFTKAWINFDETIPTWQEPFTNWVDDMAGNTGWSGDPNEPTDLFGLRNTANWTD
jgi:hypothetical protein